VSESMKGRTCVITGANGGIGRATAEELARRGATVVMICRSRERGEAARKAIAEATKATVDLVVADLSVMAQVRGAADEILKKYEKIHVLVNNAAVFLPKREVTEDGFEKTFATNYLSHFLLTQLLLDRLKASAPARIVNVATLTRGLAIDLDDLMLEKRKYSIFKAVGPTKLALILLTRELAKRLEGSGVTVNALHPGLVKTELLDDSPWLMRAIFGLLSTTPAKGAATSVYLASSGEVEKVSGKLWAKCKEVALSGPASDDGLAKRLWEASAKLVKLDGAAAVG
jgi:NAD(P)-dependent dehydrogenase (short-subunit alcohol dehydrogenase family)